ncbi:Hypothetical protein, putative [Bodo saltans]|uniref:GPI-anchored surface protein n=1 Tax=Bodo saltans TaxID=75058 RepID=A0A0S4KI96_BODSA|nr:Hypothetical protein, putative [Bodo saltans]|eukprot:CUI15408.1 Hypothetical protein, putative [Bodo saltans]
MLRHHRRPHSAAIVTFLVQLHISEGLLEPRVAPPVVLPPPVKAEKVVEPLQAAAVQTPLETADQRTPPASSLAVGGDSSTLKLSGSGSQRRVAGVCPSTPYTPLMLRHHRRPHSAAIKSNPTGSTPAATIARADSSGALSGQQAPPVLLQSSEPAMQQEDPNAHTSSRHQRRSEFVDRWLEKLYFRNPVVVTQKRSDSQLSSPATPAEAEHITATPPSAAQAGFAQARCRSADPTRSSVGQQLEIIHVANVRDDDEIVAKLPPKPVGAHSRDIRRELLEERLAQCFARGTPMSRPQSPATRGPKESRTSQLSQMVGASVSDSSTALPSVSTFVERKKRRVLA